MNKNRQFLGGDSAKVKKNIRRGILITERMNEMAEKIAQKEGISTFTGVVEAAIRLLYSKTVESYKTFNPKNKESGLSVQDTARLKIEKRQAEEKVEQDMKDERKTKICERVLFGKVEIDTGGYKYCIFSVHNKFESKESKVPLSQADPVIARSVFMPDKNSVLKARPELIKSLGLVLNKETKEYVAAEEA